MLSTKRVVLDCFNLESENVADFRVDREMRGGNAIDVELLAVGFGEIEKAADVVVLVVVGEELLGFGLAEAESRERRRRLRSLPRAIGIWRPTAARS